MCGRAVVESVLGGRRVGGERRKRGRWGAAHGHVAVPTLQQSMLGVGQLGVAVCVWRPPGQGATVCDVVVVGVAGCGRGDGLHVVAVVMVVWGRGLTTAHVAVLGVQGLDLGMPPSL